MTPQSGDEISRPPPPCPTKIEVHVHMFGMVSAMTGEREVTLHLPLDAVVNDVIAALAERYKTPLFEDAMAMAGKKTSHCRISVNGHLVREPTAPLTAEGGRSSVEIILLSAFEGG